MSKWGVTGDIHLRMFEDREYDDNGIPLKLSEVLNTFEDVCKYCRKNKIEKVAILGDVNDTKEMAAVDAFSIFKKILEKYSDITFYIIYGNHDMTSKTGERTAIDLLAGPKNVITINKPTTYGNITFLPYVHKGLVDVLTDLPDNNILMSHFGVSDAQLSNGRSLRSSISSGDLKKWQLVLCGHYHKPQTVDNLWYVGSLIPLTRAEHGEIKRFLIVDDETLEVESIETTGYRKYFDFTIDKIEDKDTIIEEATRLKNEGNFVTIRNKLPEIITEIEDKDIKVVDEYEEEFETRGINSSMNEEEKMRKYLELMRIPSVEIEEYINVGLELINKEELINE